MEYLKIFNLSDSDINDIKINIDEIDYIELISNPEKITSILKYFNSIGINNIKDILMYRTDIIFNNLEYIKSHFINVDIDTINAINEEVYNLDLLDL